MNSHIFYGTHKTWSNTRVLINSKYEVIDSCFGSITHAKDSLRSDTLQQWKKFSNKEFVCTNVIATGRNVHYQNMSCNVHKVIFQLV